MTSVEPPGATPALDDDVLDQFVELGIARPLAEILACPCPHHASLRPDAAASTLVCERCATTFPVRDGVPVLLVDDATPGPRGIGSAIAGE